MRIVLNNFEIIYDAMLKAFNSLNLKLSDFSTSSLLGKAHYLSKQKDIAFAAVVLLIIGVLIFPIPTFLLDLLLSISVAISVLILMTVMFIDRPLDLSSFPSILLIVTMLRLALNVSTTRLILSEGHKGTSAAGHVVEAFGYFVMHGSVAIGTIVFAILTIINFVVITKGSGRIAEVAARFSLDAMPGKQMAIDSEIASGAISHEEGQKRRKGLEDESTFFGAMDGANKFVRGDAIAGLLITFINFVAGIIIGTIQQDMSFEKALKTYTVLTIGDGLITQIPALIVSISAGLLVTKSGTRGSVEKAILQQLGRYPKSLMVSASLLFFMMIMPGIPAAPFFISGAVMACAAFFLYKAQQKATAIQDQEAQNTSNNQSTESTNQRYYDSLLQLDTIRLELGYDLLSLAEPNHPMKITDQIKGVRKQLAKDMGFVIPGIRIQDNLQLEGSQYIIKIKEISVGGSTIRKNKILIMEPTGGHLTIPGEDVMEPVFGLMARWVNPSHKENALLKGYTVIEPTTVIVTHLTELLKENITELLTYVEVQKLLDNLPEGHKKLVSEIIPAQISVVTLQRILQSLLGEGVSIRDFTGILEAVSEISSTTSNIMKLTEHVRVRLSKQLCYANTNDKGYIPLLALSANWEQLISSSIVGDGENKQLTMAPSKLHEFVSAVNKEYEKHIALGDTPVILTSAIIRPFVRSILERVKSRVVIMSQNEIHAKAKIKTLGQII